jgi:PknH-like extracellular domain
VITTRLLLVCLLTVMPATGCTQVTSGTVRSAPNIKPRPLSRQTVKQVLLDSVALAKILEQPFEPSRLDRSWFGGREKLQSDYGLPSRAECLGLTTVQEKTSYEAADIKDVAGSDLWHVTGAARVMSVREGVVSLPTVVDAAALFAKLVAQWQQCGGVTLTLQVEDQIFTEEISDVRAADSVVAATVSAKASRPDSSPLPHARAIGVRVNCLVDVEIAFYGSTDVGDRGSGDVNTSGIKIAHILMDRVSALS